MALNPNSPDHHLFSVEPVESVTKSNLPPFFIDKPYHSTLEYHSTKAKSQSVESVTKNDLHGYFSTLSTEMKKQSVEDYNSISAFNINGLCNIPQIPQIPQEKTDEPENFPNHDKKDLELVFRWLRVALDEGHLEPSQPAVGRIVRWPTRSFLVETLFNEFTIWCGDRGLLRWQVPCKMLFSCVLDKIFSREGDKYAFPLLNECRAKFAMLEARYEYN